MDDNTKIETPDTCYKCTYSKYVTTDLVQCQLTKSYVSQKRWKNERWYGYPFGATVKRRKGAI